MEKVTESDLLAALRMALQKPESENGMTTLELAENVGCSKHTMLRALHRLDKEGKLKVVRVKRKNLVGTTITIPGYMLKEGEDHV